jgi:hypothetical protein
VRALTREELPVEERVRVVSPWSSAEGFAADGVLFLVGELLNFLGDSVPGDSELPYPLKVMDKWVSGRLFIPLLTIIDLLFVMVCGELSGTL